MLPFERQPNQERAWAHLWVELGDWNRPLKHLSMLIVDETMLHVIQPPIAEEAKDMDWYEATSRPSKESFYHDWWSKEHLGARGSWYNTCNSLNNLEDAFLPKTIWNTIEKISGVSGKE